MPASSCQGSAAADVFYATESRLRKIDMLVEEMQADLRALHRYGSGGDGEEEDDVVDLEHIEICSFMEQVKSAVQQVRLAIQEKAKRIKKCGSGGGGGGDDDEEQPSSSSRETGEDADRKFVSSAGSGHLRSVVDSLDPQLKQCVLCISVFPAGKVIKKRLLIHWWIGEGIVQSAAAGKACFRDLLSRGLLQPAVRRPHCDTVHYCMIHPSVRMILVAAGEKFGYFAFDRDGDPTDDCLPGTTRRMTLCRTRGLVGGGGRHDEYLTLYNLSQRYVEIDKAWLARQRVMGTLQLGRWRTSPEHHVEIILGPSVLDAAAACKNLRYLSLRGISLIESVPESIGSLRDLVVLDARACHNLESLPESMAFLTKLEYLDVSECYLLDQMPHGVCKLPRLQVLKGFVVGAEKATHPCRLADLAALPQLRKLSISTGRHLSVAPEDELPRLHGCTSLESLSLRWGSAAAAGRPRGGDDDDEAGGTRMDLSLLPRLAKLDLQRVPVEQLQELVHPARGGDLKKLYVRGGRLAAFGDAVRWGGVETLRVRFLEHLDCDWQQVRRSFGKLRLVEKWECGDNPGLGSWRCDAKGVWRREDDAGVAGDRC